LYDALTVITKLIAPVLPHTADEVWKLVPGAEEISVQLTLLPEANTSVYDEALEARWEKLIDVRDEVNKALEEARNKKVIGNSLGANLELYPDAETEKLLKGFADLDQLFIVSHVTVKEAGSSAPADAAALKGLSVLVLPADGEKCERCWIVTPEVGTVEKHPTLCCRCGDVVSEHYEG